MSDEYCQVMVENGAQLSTSLPWREVLDYLLTEEVLSSQDDAYQIITREGLTPNNRRRQLLRFVWLSGDKVFVLFLKALADISPDLAKTCFGKMLEHG